jgi:hypothetical protein
LSDALNACVGHGYPAEEDELANTTVLCCKIILDAGKKRVCILVDSFELFLHGDYPERIHICTTYNSPSDTQIGSPAILSAKLSYTWHTALIMSYTEQLPKVPAGILAASQNTYIGVRDLRRTTCT